MKRVFPGSIPRFDLAAPARGLALVKEIAMIAVAVLVVGSFAVAATPVLVPGPATAALAGTAALAASPAREAAESSPGAIPRGPRALSQRAMEAAAEYSALHGGAAVLVMQNGEIVFERYEAGTDAETAMNLHSGTKGFWGPVVAAMIEDGLIDSFEQHAADFIPEWQGRPWKQEITIRHLLNLTCGLPQDLPALQGYDRPTLAPDLYAHAVQLPLIQLPGRRFSYGPSCYYALGAVLKNVLAERNMTPLDYLKARILDPIGVEIGDWVHDASGNPHIPNGAFLSARNWARYGQWLLQEGAWNGTQIVRPDLMRQLREPSEANPGHGLAIWLNRPMGYDPQDQRAGRPPAPGPGGFIYPDGHPDIFAAMGAGKNRMYIIPELSVVAVRQTHRLSDRFEDEVFLRLLLEER